MAFPKSTLPLSSSVGVSRKLKTLSQEARPRCSAELIVVSCLIGEINIKSAVMKEINPPALALAWPVD
jgi:hypothetical protein